MMGVMKKWIDITVPLRRGMVHWPDNPPIGVERIRDMDRGDSHNISQLSLGSHTGTHMDAPLHFIRDGKGIDTMPAEATVGRARVIEIKDKESIEVSELTGYHLRRGERVLFKTVNSVNAWGTDNFVENFVFISTEAAEFLVRRGVRAVGVDYLSVGGYQRNAAEVHKILLGAGVWLIEGLDLSQVKPGHYDLVCLPLKLANGDGAPARAMLRPI
jgi:arylformamidase